MVDVSGLGFTTQATISIQYVYGLDWMEYANNLAYIELQVRRPNGSVVYLYLARDHGSGGTLVFDVMGGAARM